jgi:hypothetical protein
MTPISANSVDDGKLAHLVQYSREGDYSSQIRERGVNDPSKRSPALKPGASWIAVASVSDQAIAPIGPE